MRLFAFQKLELIYCVLPGVAPCWLCTKFRLRTAQSSAIATWRWKAEGVAMVMLQLVTVVARESTAGGRRLL